MGHSGKNAFCLFPNKMQQKQGVQWHQWLELQQNDFSTGTITDFAFLPLVTASLSWKLYLWSQSFIDLDRWKVENIIYKQTFSKHREIQWHMIYVFFMADAILPDCHSTKNVITTKMHIWYFANHHKITHTQKMLKSSWPVQENLQK